MTTPGLRIGKGLGGVVCTLLAMGFHSAASAEAPGAPGIPHHWAPALKQAVGTSYESKGAQSPLWFTVAEGIVTEVFYPTVDTAQVGDLQFIVTDGKKFFSEQKRHTSPHVTYENEGLTVLVTGADPSGYYSYEQRIVTDSSAPVLRIRTVFHWNVPGLRLHVLFKPALGNSGQDGFGQATNEGLFAYRGDEIHAALTSSLPWASSSAGYVGYSDGWQDLSRHFRLTDTYPDAGPGNIALVGEVAARAGGFDQSTTVLELALAFGSNRDSALALSQTSLNTPFSQLKAQYEEGWLSYLEKLQQSPLNKDSRFIFESAFARRSAQLIKIHEDKHHRGMIVASLSKPGIPDGDRAANGNTGGYHLVWGRDLFHAAMGLLAAGDWDTPLQVLGAYARTQKPDGSWWQNAFVSGQPYWRGLQMDQVAYPILLAERLNQVRPRTVTPETLEMVRKAASFLMTQGPATDQDRWEEIGGYVPSTLAAEIAGLRAASRLTGDPGPASVAEQWESRLERWTLVPNGVWGNNYYLRVSPSGTPAVTETIGIANGGGSARASDILDGGFLELVRLGIRTPTDPRIQTTLRALESPEAHIAQADDSLPDGVTYRRYNRDAYGHNRVGGFWPLLAGERGHFAVAARDLPKARNQLSVLERSAIDSGLIPEQTASAPSPRRVKVGLGVACPLVWAHAEDILLHRSIEEGRIFDSPRE